MGDLLIYISVALMIGGVIALIVIAFTRGLDTARLTVALPITLIFLVTDKRGRWAWLAIALGVVLLLIGVNIE